MKWYFRLGFERMVATFEQKRSIRDHGFVLSITVVTSHMWLFKLKLNEIKNPVSHISSAQKSQVANDYHVGQCITFPSPQKVLLDPITTECLGVGIRFDF